MDQLSLVKSPFEQFSIDEILELERMFQEMGGKPLDRNCYEEIAIKLSSTSHHVGKTTLSWEQVQLWFQNKQKELAADVTFSPDPLKVVVDQSAASFFRNGHRNSSTPKGKPATELKGLKFEARSFKDFAWHDVASFLNFRVMSTGELEVRVRYAGFGKDEDEWVNVKGGVRQASTPLEPSECHKVKDGDIVLCFKESDDYALYCDACVLKITRQEHDPVECNCIFTVQYEYDNSEADVYGKDICCRPSEEKSVALALPMQSIESLWG
ncbi:PREDICTED: protein SAWADEE HOMEODOMAIN HOMOLOG 1-like [Lupinus angustifolius]|uniref:protein SAWADEE HOMEODOMAIN HOMOLOG 1-like n=1 Tax=Lupinus angustifolius TaxID=3871 RepID=UPI00092E4981|nr:PREDICTED: protein SAWADEE HOMEODOMAIN HOMOLOG 1-like [Lupinus angustifolius]XP_019429314.1 PREDICTED: protein SAWADEE HOMEODOMAIN HOMOLOG 1-like [Lupinus angustifolius]XP_019429315.1 PREDICTED: protein SAWADEE HOMEODOMAIN HOMOLOG 1-like [Lupinus angustifolius]